MCAGGGGGGRPGRIPTSRITTREPTHKQNYDQGAGWLAEAQKGPERPREARRSTKKRREPQIGPERPREVRRGSERPREAQRSPESLR